MIVEVDLPVSSNTSFSVSPFSRLMPLKEASCAVVVICVMIWLYWLTSDERVACDTASATGAAAAPNVAVPGVDHHGNRTDRGRSEVVGRGDDELLELSRLAVRLPAAKAVFSWSSDSVAPKVTVTAGRAAVRGECDSLDRL